MENYCDQYKSAMCHKWHTK